MKTPLLNEDQRLILKVFPNSLNGSKLRLHIELKRFEREVMVRTVFGKLMHTFSEYDIRATRIIISKIKTFFS